MNTHTEAGLCSHRVGAQHGGNYFLQMQSAHPNQLDTWVLIPGRRVLLNTVKSYSLVSLTD